MTLNLEEIKQKLDTLEVKEPEGEPVVTAFLVLQKPDGQWAAISEFADLDLSQERVATFDDIVGGCSNVIMGCQVQQSALATIIMMEQRAQQMQQQMMAQQEAQRVASLIDPKKLRS